LFFVSPIAGLIQLNNLKLVAGHFLWSDPTVMDHSG
jgi:hypothetical protein